MALQSGDHIWYYDGQGTVSGELTSTAQKIPRQAWFPGVSATDENDYGGNGNHIFNFVLYDSEIRWGQPHMRNKPGSFAWLNNNPGNLTGVAGGPDFNQIPNKFNWHSFLVFPDHDTGFAAIASFLRQGPYPALSILDAFQKYAAASDGNNPVQYANNVAAAAGIPTSTLVGDLTDDQMLEMQNEIEKIEGSVPGNARPYNSQDIPATVQALVSEV